MKKTLSLILCLTMILTFIPTGSVWASDEVTETEYVSKTIDISAYSNKISMANLNDANIKANYNSLALGNSGDMYLIDIDSIKSSLTWKEDWTDSMTSNTATFNGIDYKIPVVSANNGGRAGFATGGSNITLSVESGHYTGVKLLANSWNGVGVYTSYEKQLPIGIILNYADGTQEYKTTENIYGPFRASENALSFTTVKLSGGLWSQNTLTASSKDTKNAYMHPYEVSVDSEKELKSITVMSENKKATQNGDAITVEDANGTHSQAAIFAVTAVTTQELIDKYAPISKTIDISAYSNKQSMAGFNETIKANYCCLAYNGGGINPQCYVIDINDVKNNSALTWKEEWTADKTLNTATYEGVEYLMHVQSASKGKAGMRIENEEGRTFDIEDGYYESVKLLANSLNGPSKTNWNYQYNTGIVLNYTDGTQEYKETGVIYDPFTETDSSIEFKTIQTGNLWSGNDVTTQASNATLKAYMHLYEVSVNSGKKLDSITVLGEKTTASESNGAVTLTKGNSSVHSGTSFFAITAVTNQLTIDNGARLDEEEAKANALSELKTLASEINTDSLDYNSYTTIESLNKAIEKCENYGISIDSETQSKITSIKAKWESFVSVPVAMTNNLNIMAYADYNSSFEVNYNHLGMWTTKAISLKDMKKLSYDGDVLAFKGLKYNMPVKQSPEAVARNNGVALDYNYSVTPGYYRAIKIMANGYRGKNAPNAQYVATTTKAGALLKLIYDDGSWEYKETDTIHYCTDSSIKTASYWNGIEVPSVSLTGLNNGCDGTATAGSENSGDYIYINSYEISANPHKRLLSITIVGMSSAEGKAYVNSQENREDSTIANANIFAMTGVMATDENSKNYNTAINALLNTIGDASSLTYTEANFKNISKLTSLVNCAKSFNVTIEKENEVNAVLTAWANCQSDLMLISPEQADIAFSDNILSAVVTATNRKSDNAVSGVAIIALYDKTTNRFLDMTMANKSFEKNTQVEIGGEFDIRNYEGVTSFGVKCFVWDTLTDIKALMNPVTLQ